MKSMMIILILILIILILILTVLILMGMTGCALCKDSGGDELVKGSDPFLRFFFAIKQLLPFSHTDAD